ncbi:hypothetical protein [Nocardia arthritidis]|uniref:Preprotein translocase subunit SecD n=1 Tax=Nocardia arthritidis TaxID=228602 RepID=A0A6G9Y6I2_9NOCA|nr:hypothetical protein [Nocardia arthritidis]QIS08687.1 hypothetical protein F5544_03865 [Nocardia arthritidis]
MGSVRLVVLSRIAAVAALVLVPMVTQVQAQAGPASCAAGNPLRPTAELFATDNTSTITDPADERLRTRLDGFELQVDGIVAANIALPVGSTLVSGVFWSEDQRQTTYERSREFHLACVTGPDLHNLADQVRAQFRQESVLTFEPLPADAPGVDGFTATVPGIDVRRFHDALVADPVARQRLVGGSVTEDNRLIVVADIADYALAQRFVTELGGDWNAADVRFGDREFVGS